MNISALYRAAANAKLVSPPDKNALARARRAYRKHLAEPGDCILPHGGIDISLIAGLAIAFADIGYCPGWIPETQRIGVAIAKLP